MESKAKLVVIGAGIAGCSAAWHLVKKGWRDIVVVDQGPLPDTGGSTSHAPGLIFQTNSSKLMTEFAQYTVELLAQLNSDQLPTLYPVGGVEVAYTQERWTELKRKHGWATAYNLEAYLISPAEVKEKVPLIDDSKILGGYYVLTDGDAHAVNAVTVMAREAQANGAAHFYGNTKVIDIEVDNGCVKAVVTENGRIETEKVLLCTNIWSPVLSRKLGLNIPLMAVEHLYAITEPLPELAGETRPIVHPVLRHQDRSMYFRQHADAYGVGSYYHEPLLVKPEDVGQVAMHPFTPEHFTESWKETVKLLPPLKDAGLATKFNGMFSFTIDGMPVMGEVLGTAGFWVAVGVWVTHSGGVGRAIAEWMTGGVSATDLREADVNRFHPHAYAQSYITTRSAQQYREVYDIIHPLQQIENPRNLRLTPFHTRLQEQDAVFFESAGWERPHWFDKNKSLVSRYNVPSRQGWAAVHWSPIQGAEHHATRNSVAMYDLSAFTKIHVSGPGAADFLEYLAANRIDQPVGKVVYTALLNEEGGIKCDLTITRLAPDSFWVLTGGAIGMHDLAWIKQQAPQDGSVHIEDITSRYGTIGLWGPKARDVLKTVCENDLSNEAFPYFSARQIFIDNIPAVALRVSYVGEMGWEIYTLTEYGLRLWDLLWDASQPFGGIVAGGGAFDSLRLEKGYRFWGVDMHTEYNPYEAGLGWAVKLNKGNFLGRDALLRIKKSGITRKLCCMTLDDPEAVLLGKEPIFSHSRTLGYVTSANYGYTVEKFIAYGYLPLEYAQAGTSVEIEYFGRRYKATVTREPLYDPKQEKLKAE